MYMYLLVYIIILIYDMQGGFDQCRDEVNNIKRVKNVGVGLGLGF